MNQVVEAACFKNKLPSESHLQSLIFDLSVKLGFAKNVHCYLKKTGFALSTSNVSPVTCVRFAILSLRKRPLPNLSKLPSYSKTAKPMQICAVVPEITLQKNSY